MKLNTFIKLLQKLETKGHGNKDVVYDEEWGGYKVIKIKHSGIVGKMTHVGASPLKFKTHDENGKKFKKQDCNAICLDYCEPYGSDAENNSINLSKLTTQLQKFVAKGYGEANVIFPDDTDGMFYREAELDPCVGYYKDGNFSEEEGNQDKCNAINIETKPCISCNSID